MTTEILVPGCPICGECDWSYTERGRFWDEFLLDDKGTFKEDEDEHESDNSNFMCRSCAWNSESRGESEAEEAIADALYAFRDGPAKWEWS